MEILPRNQQYDPSGPDLRHMLPALDHIVVILFSVIYPIYGLLVYPKSKLKQLARQFPARLRKRLYIGTTVWLWSLALLAIFAWLREERPISELGLSVPGGPGFWIGACLALASMIFQTQQLLEVRRSESARLRIRQQVTTYSQILPRSSIDMFLFACLSITAGVCEELLYRGFLMSYIDSYFNLGIAVLGSAILFGLCHAYYQGWYGALRTGGMGVVFSGLYILTGSLWLPMLLHAFIDINGGRIVRAAFQEPGNNNRLN